MRGSGAWMLAGMLLATAAAWAGDRPASRNAMAFLQLGAGARAYGMGEAFCGLADDVASLSWNPGGLGQISDTQILFMHNQWIANLRQESLAAAYPLPLGCAGFKATYLNSDIQERRDSEGMLAGNGFNPYSAAAGLGLGMDLGAGLYAGAVLNYAREQLDDATYASGYLDAGALYRPRDPEAWWSAGVSVSNLGTAVAGYSLPLTLRAGAAARLFQDRLLVSAEASRTLPGWFRYSLGVEFWYENLFAIRAGYSFRPEREGLDALSGVRAGLGFNLQGYQLDYALIPQGDLGYGHRASFTYFFGGGRALASEKQRLIHEARKRGKAALHAQDFALAVDSYQKVLTFVPEDAEARGHLALAQKGLAREEQEKETKFRLAKAEDFRRSGQWEDAMDEFQRVLLIDEQNTAAIQGLARVRAEYNAKAVQKNLEDGRHAFASKTWADALLAWQAVLSIEPGQPEATRMLALTRSEMVKGGKGFKDPRIAEYYLAGLRRFEGNDYPGAALHWHKVLKLAPQHADARRYLAMALKLLARNVEELLAAGSRYAQAGDWVRAAASWRKARLLAPDHPQAVSQLKTHDPTLRQRAKELYLKGIEHYTRGSLKQSIASWKDTLTLIPDYPGAAENIEKARQKLKALQ